MAKIILSYRIDHHRATPVPTYSTCFHRELEALGHEVFPVGEGHPNKAITDVAEVLIKQHDLFIDLDCGRNSKGDLHFQNKESIKIRIPTAVWFIDSHNHNNSTLHRRLAKRYNHVFFAVWNKRDLFENHPSAHFCPNASDIKWFNFKNHIEIYKEPKFDLGFFGSKMGLSRAYVLKDISKETGLTIDIREVGRAWKVRWPRTAEAMCNCGMLFNRSQKHDINQRIFESMLCNRPLITDFEKQSGIDQLFKPYKHFLPYITEWGNEKEQIMENIDWYFQNTNLAKDMSISAYSEVKEKHQIKNRVEQILSICLN